MGEYNNEEIHFIGILWSKKDREFIPRKESSALLPETYVAVQLFIINLSAEWCEILIGQKRMASVFVREHSLKGMTSTDSIIVEVHVF